jgi:hypothetical protein
VEGWGGEGRGQGQGVVVMVGIYGRQASLALGQLGSSCASNAAAASPGLGQF